MHTYNIFITGIRLLIIILNILVDIICASPPNVPTTTMSDIIKPAGKTNITYGSTVQYQCSAKNVIDFRNATCNLKGKWDNVPVFCSSTLKMFCGIILFINESPYEISLTITTTEIKNPNATTSITKVTHNFT